MLPPQRHLFSLPDNLHYLNSASRAPLLKTAEAAGIEGLQWHRVPESLAGKAYFGPSETLREQVGALIHTTPDRIAVIPAVSYGVAIAASFLGGLGGRHVLMPEEEFPSNVYTWWAPHKEDAPRIRFVPRPDGAADLGAAWNERLLESIDHETAVVHLSTVHWTDGMRFDAEAIGRRAREMGALFILDGTQSIGAEPFDFEAVAPDLLVCAGYKWLMGPYQAGFAALGDRLLGAWPFEHHWSNRAGSENPGATAYSDDFRPGARRFDVGEHANPITLPMLNEGLRQVLAWGPENVRAYCNALMGDLDTRLEGTGGVARPAHERAAHIAGIRLPDETSLVRALEALAARNVRVSRRGDVLRVSPHVFNTEDDLAALIEGLKAAAQ